MLRPVRLGIYAYAHLNVQYIDYNSLASYDNDNGFIPICDLLFVSALLAMIKFSMHKRVRILDS